MTKREELQFANSCLNKAKEDEYIFVLLSRDPAAPHAIRAWCDKRILLGLNQPKDAKIEEALRLAARMEGQRQ